MTPRVLKPRPQLPNPAPKLDGCGWFVTPLTRFYPSPAGRGGLGYRGWDHATFRLGWANGPLSSAARLGPLKRGAFASEKAGDAPSPCDRGRSPAEESAKASEAGDLGSARPPAHESSLCLCLSFSSVRRSFLFCKSGLITLTLPLGVSCGSDK